MPVRNINLAVTSILAEDSLLSKAVKIGDLGKAVQIANNALQAISQSSTLDRKAETKVKLLFFTVSGVETKPNYMWT